MCHIPLTCLHQIAFVAWHCSLQKGSSRNQASKLTNEILIGSFCEAESLFILTQSVIWDEYSSIEELTRAVKRRVAMAARMAALSLLAVMAYGMLLMALLQVGGLSSTSALCERVWWMCGYSAALKNSLRMYKQCSCA